MRSSIVATVLLVILHGGCTPTADHSAPAASPSAAAPPNPLTAAPSPPAASGTPQPNVRDGVPSDAGMFVGAWTSAPDVLPINTLHEWVLHIESPSGEPVEGATVTVDGDMPAHGHGMPTTPQVTADLGGGDYRVEGMSFQMGGYWVIDVTVTTADGTDVIRFGLDL